MSYLKGKDYMSASNLMIVKQLIIRIVSNYSKRGRQYAFSIIGKLEICKTNIEELT